MDQLKNNTHAPKLKKQVSFITGMSLLIMCFLAPIAVFLGLEPNIVSGDASQTYANLVASGNPLGWIGTIFVLIVILDIIISWGVYVIFKSEDESLATLTGWLRLLYSGILLMATVPLFQASNLLSLPVQSDQALMAHEISRFVETFQMTWDVGLGIFGLHLVVLGILVFKSVNFNKALGALVSVAGLGYTIDAFGLFLSPDYNLSIGSYAFIGEVLLIFWLIWRSFKGYKEQ